jgi:K+-sensing histidine kinase KdpD
VNIFGDHDSAKMSQSVALHQEKAYQQLTYSVVSNLIQNALTYTHAGGQVQVGGNLVGKHIVEVEDECGGLLSNTGEDLFGRPGQTGVQWKNRPTT